MFFSKKLKYYVRKLLAPSNFLFLCLMKGKKSWLLPSILLVFAISIHFFSADIIWVDRYYTNGLYPCISKTLKYAFGWLPFSIGDILYGICAAWLFFIVVKITVRIFQGRITKQLLIKGLRNILTRMLWIYILFNLLWGINYNSPGIAEQVGIKMEKYSTRDIFALDSLLLLKVNISKLALSKSQYLNTASMSKSTIGAYQEVKKKYSFLNAEPASLKPSLWGWLGNYLGFTGYYNPFTGEAQVNTTVPEFVQPFTFCHETAHQLGYAKENEANFVGYLAAVASRDTAFHYSVYLDLFLYAQRNLYFVDSAAAKSQAKKLLPLVKADLTELRKFNERHQNPVEPMVRWLYSSYLRNNQQPSGVLSYDEVIGFLIAYYKKFGTI